MKYYSYSFGSWPQFISATFAFVLNVTIPYFIGDPINWLTVALVTVSVFLASGFRYERR